MKNFQKLALGLLVGILAIGFSAFTNAPSNSKVLTLYWFNTNTAGNTLTSPDQISDLDNPTSEPCSGSSVNYCARGFTEAQTYIDGNHRRPSVAITSGAPAKKP